MRRSAPHALMGKITLYCQPGARTTRLAGIHDGKPKVQLQAQPVDGEANKALIRFLSVLCNVSQSAIHIESGTSSRIKRVSVEGQSDEALVALLGNSRR